MGAFFLIGKGPGADGAAAVSPEGIERALAVFAGKGMELNRVIRTTAADLYLYHKLVRPGDQVLEFPDGGFIAATGTLLYRGRAGLNALSGLYEEFRPGEGLPGALSGNFAVIIGKQGGLFLFTDRTGLYHVFGDRDGRVFSSSLLAAAKACERRTVNPQGFFEYVLNGAVYGDETVLEEVVLLDSTRFWTLAPEPGSWPRPAPEPAAAPGSFAEWVEIVAADLVEYFAMIGSEWGNDVCSALSGGYDSRLMLALMRKTGIAPYLYVYGKPGDADVRVARRIAEGEGLTLHHRERSMPEAEDPDRYLEQLRRRYFLHDGLGNEGIFDNGFALASRLERVKAAGLQLNGGGGEIYRNFWMLPNRHYSASAFLKSKYDREDYSIFRGTFAKERYFALFAEKVRGLLGGSGGSLSRRQIEMLYPMLRLRYWMGINNSHNCQFAATLTPFADDGIIWRSYDIPLGFKNHGRLEAAVIRRLDPRLAAYVSDYGYDFSGGIPWRKQLADLAVMNTPVFVRPLMRRRVHKKSRIQARPLPYYLRPDFRAGLGLARTPAIDDLVDITVIRNPELLSRALSVELLLQDRF